MVVFEAFRRAARPCLFILILLAVSPVYGQVPGSDQTGLGAMNLTNPIQQLRQRLAGSAAAGANLALEGALDPEAYLVGPGDQFSISVGGAVPLEVTAAVSADGAVIIPGVASVQAANKNLASVVEEVKGALRPQYQNVPIDVALTQPRQFYVHVTGAIPEPNRYLTMAMSRVSDVLEQAYAVKAFELQYIQATAQLPPTAEKPPLTIPSVSSERPELNSSYRPSLRNVILERDGKTRVLDLFDYFTSGHTENNPYLLDGDVITVPAYHVERDAVVVTGEVPYPGRFEYREGDTILDILQLAVGPAGLKNLNQVRVIRRSEAERVNPMVLNVKEMVSGNAEPASVRPGDRLDVLTSELQSAAIYGFIEYPGTYPIESGKTTLKELLETAGGLKPDANIRAAYIERRQSNFFKGEGRATDLDLFSRAYLQQEFNNNRLVVNVQEALASGGEDIVLYNGDTVVFPRDEGTVFVAGHVPKSGYVEYVPGKNASYYVDAAGGKGPLAAGVYVFDNTGHVRRGTDAAVYSGDTIFVNRDALPDNPELATIALTDITSRRQTRIMTTQTIITGISAITSIITAYVAITR